MSLPSDVILMTTTFLYDFLFYAQENNTESMGVFTVFDGVKDKSKLNTIDKWNGMSSLNYWYTPQANMMNGTGW